MTLSHSSPKKYKDIIFPLLATLSFYLLLKLLFRTGKTKFNNRDISFLRIFRALRWRITRRGCGNFLDRRFVARSVTLTAEYSRSTCTSILWREVRWGMSTWYIYTVPTGGRSISFPLANEVIYIQKLIRPKVANLDESLLRLPLPAASPSPRADYLL